MDLLKKEKEKEELWAEEKEALINNRNKTDESYLDKMMQRKARVDYKIKRRLKTFKTGVIILFVVYYLTTLLLFLKVNMDGKTIISGLLVIIPPLVTLGISLGME